MHRLALFVLCSCLFAQLTPAPEVQRLPAWSDEGELPPALSSHHLFRDPTSGDIVVSYPDANEHGKRVSFRYALANRVEPSITVSVHEESGIYGYEYSVRNGPDAKTPIRMWSIVGPAQDPKLEVSHRTWYASRGRVANAPQTAVPSAGSGAHLFWSRWDAPIAVNGTVVEFRIQSSFSPGLTTAYAVGDGHLSVPSDVPGEVMEELQPFQSPRVMWYPVLTVGPRYPAGLSQSQLSAQFLIDIDGAIKVGALEESAFVRYAKTRLVAESDPNAVVRDNVPPRGSTESAIAQALNILFPTR